MLRTMDKHSYGKSQQKIEELFIGSQKCIKYHLVQDL